MDTRSVQFMMGILFFERMMAGAWSDIGMFLFWNMILYGFYILFWMMVDIFIIGTPVVTYMQEGLQICDEWKEWKYEKMKEWGWKSKPDFYIKEMRLYNGEGENKLINTYFEKISSSILAILYEQTFKKRIWNHPHPSDIRLKITYQWKDEEYILYYSYENPIFQKSITLQIPFITQETVQNYRKDIIQPLYSKDTGKYSLYSLFMMDCHDIYQIFLNGKSISLHSYFKKIAGPYHDFGLLMHLPVKLKWILEENEIEGELHVIFLNEYLDENMCELKKQEWKSKDVNDYFITEHMKDVMKKKNQEYEREFRFYEREK